MASRTAGMLPDNNTGLHWGNARAAKDPRLMADAVSQVFMPYRVMSLRLRRTATVGTRFARR